MTMHESNLIGFMFLKIILAAFRKLSLKEGIVADGRWVNGHNCF